MAVVVVSAAAASRLRIVGVSMMFSVRFSPHTIGS